MSRTRVVDTAEVVRLYRDKRLGSPSIGRILNIHHTTVLYHLNLAGVERRNEHIAQNRRLAARERKAERIKFRTLRNAEIVERYLQGFNHREVSQKMRVSTDVIGKVLRAAGIPPHQGRVFTPEQRERLRAIVNANPVAPPQYKPESVESVDRLMRLTEHRRAGAIA